MATVMTNVSWKARVLVTRPGAESLTHRRVRFVLEGDEARVVELDGYLTATIHVTDLTRRGPRRLTVEGDGQTWEVERVGCGCGES